ncbi:hypothetical protein [Teichococcus vastitatis]|jgi:hypothetical protein|uniref:DUF2474 domain-containing protein n=1 Tax=Teichococcus vastitatis TaxID=2307076 RepID=A0ABS9W1Q9_9PROT|nr:hypothetical protein [Pseudoroseomonas vastitatis]MCI0753228.1 hypothetical protein [Pseudoroseomonas vastitatis]
MNPLPFPPAPRAGTPPVPDALRRLGGFALLGASVWLVAIIALFRALVGLFT